jgi:phosphoribosylformylglycinamidine synthase
MAGDGRTGAEVDLSPWALLPRRALFYGEAHGRVLVSTDAPDRVLSVAEARDVPARVIGRVRPAGDGFVVRVGATAGPRTSPGSPDAYHEAIPALMQRPAAHSA